MGKKKRRKTAFKMVYIPKRVVEVFSFFLSFSFLVLVFGLWFLTVALLAWRVVFFFSWWGLGWVGVGVGVHYTTQGKFCPRLDYTTGTCYLLLIDEMGGRDGRVWAGGRRQDAFCWKSRTDRNLPLLA